MERSSAPLSPPGRSTDTRPDASSKIGGLSLTEIAALAKRRARTLFRNPRPLHSVRAEVEAVARYLEWIGAQLCPKYGTVETIEPLAVPPDAVQSPP